MLKIINHYQNKSNELLYIRDGKDLENIEVDLRLNVIKPLHAQWLINMYNYFSTPNGRETIVKGWNNAGIHEVVKALQFCHLITCFKVYILDSIVSNLSSN